MNRYSWLLLVGACLPAAAQPDSVVSPVRNRTVWISTAGAYTASMVGLNALWYSQYERQPFRFFDDSREWKQMDKIGHFYSAYQVAAGGAATWRWAGHDEKTAARRGAIISFAILSSIEILDGFSAGYGASASDWVANLAGAALYWGQSAGWQQQRLQPKYSFRRTPLAAVRPELLGNGWVEEWIKDYNGQTYWLSVDLQAFLPGWPRWLHIAPGYSAYNMVSARDASSRAAGYAPYRQYFLGLDFDLSFLRGRNKWVNTLLFIVNLIRLPAPALEFSNGRMRAHWLYF